MKFVIKRTDQGGGYVSRPGSEHSYTNALQKARTYPSREAAERDRCPGNEIILSIDEAVGGDA